jgi:hypothetical protein
VCSKHPTTGTASRSEMAAAESAVDAIFGGVRAHSARSSQRELPQAEMPIDVFLANFRGGLNETVCPGRSSGRPLCSCSSLTDCA